MLLNEIVKKAHANSVAHKFWEGVPNIPEKLLLIHSEVSECCECLRDESGDKVPDPGFLDNPEGQYAFDLKNYPDTAFKHSVKDTLPDELADIVIRVADLAGYLGYDLARHVELKMAYNESRPIKHGKNF